jgi:hypothetical protein
MTVPRIGRREAVLVLAFAAFVVAVGWPPGAHSGLAAPSGIDRQVVLILLPGRPYEEALRDPLLNDLARRGGIGLLTTSGEAQHPSQAAVSLSAGRSAEAAPFVPVRFEDVGAGLLVDDGPYRRAPGDAEAGLLGTTLAETGHSVGYVDLRSAGGDPAMLLAMDQLGRIPAASLNSFPMLGQFSPEFLNPEAAGVVERSELVVSPNLETVRFVLEHSTAGRVAILVVSAPPSAAMRERGDTVTPVILSHVLPGVSVGQPETGEPSHGLTSPTTRRDGLVSNVDIAPTVLRLLETEAPEDMLGAPIVARGEPPTELHRRYLEWREVVTPVGQIVLGLAILSLLVGLALILGPWRPSSRIVRTVAVAGLASVALLVSLVPASLLPTFTWPFVLAALAAGATVLVALALRRHGRSPIEPVIAIAGVGLAMVAIDVATGWRTGSTPLLGGSALDGERFFGLGNPYAGIVLAGAVLGAAKLSVRTGVLLLALAAAFAGLPFLGADVGGCITLAIVAALWYGMNRWGRLGRRTWALAAVSGVVAVAFLVVTHRLLPPGETHVSRAVSDAGGVLGAIDVFWQRFLLNVRLTSEAPSSWLAVLGLPVWLMVALQPPRRLRPILEGHPIWRRAVVVLAIGGMLGYVLNDTFGMAGIAFFFVSAAVVYPALALRWRGEGLRESSPATAPADG